LETKPVRFLADHDIEGYAQLLWGTLAVVGWLELIPLELKTFRDIPIPVNSSDREVWRFAQANGLILITNNRNMKAEDSLERTIREENQPNSLPVLTIGSVERLTDLTYREQCADALVEISLDLERHTGRGRIYIP
jgi:predicted nuclease of predicted toxin-antitoxin system